MSKNTNRKKIFQNTKIVETATGPVEISADGTVLVGDYSPLSQHFRSSGSLTQFAPIDKRTQGVTNQPIFVTSTKYEDHPIVNEEELQVIKKFYENENLFLHNRDEKTYLEYINSLDEIHKNAWIQTYSGRKFYPLNPYIDSIVIQDISHALSMQCRFNGHTKKFYSVAQHCVGVSYLCEPGFELQGLLHDGSEFALGDVNSPIKRTSVFKEYKKAEKILQSAIYHRFGVSTDEHASVKKADLIMLATEARDLMSPLHTEFKLKHKPLPFKIEPLPPEEAEQLFLDRFKELTT